MYALDAMTGKVVWEAYTVPTELRQSHRADTEASRGASGSAPPSLSGGYNAERGNHASHNPR